MHKMALHKMLLFKMALEDSRAPPSPGSPVHKMARLGARSEEVKAVVPAITRAVPEAPETPRTPRSVHVDRLARSSTPPPLVPTRLLCKPRLLQAMEMNSAEQVRTALEHTPEIAKDLFWDHECEPPLCSAVRLKCSSAVVELLLEYGADAEAKDVFGRTPAEMLRQQAIPCEHGPDMDYGFQFAGLMPGLFPVFPLIFGSKPCWHQEAAMWRQEVAGLLAA